MKSVFQELIGKWFAKTAKHFYDKINGSKEEPTYLHDQMLDEEYSDDMTYTSISGNFTSGRSFSRGVQSKKKGLHITKIMIITKKEIL